MKEEHQELIRSRSSRSRFPSNVNRLMAIVSCHSVMKGKAAGRDVSRIMDSAFVRLHLWISKRHNRIWKQWQSQCFESSGPKKVVMLWYKQGYELWLANSPFGRM